LLVKAEAGAFTSRLWVWVLAPGAAIFVAVIGFTQIGYALEEIFNPKVGAATAALKASGEVTEQKIQAAIDSMRELTAEEAAAARSEFGLAETQK
jgi:hypothetical protein